MDPQQWIHNGEATAGLGGGTAQEGELDREESKLFMGRLFEMASGAAVLGVLAVADQTGLLRALDGAGPQSLADVCERSGLQPRYVEEILATLVAADFVDFDAAVGCYALTPEKAACLADEQSPYFMGGWTQILQGLYGAVPGVARASREGGGVPYSDYGAPMVDGIARANSPGTRMLLTRRWLAAASGWVERLEAGGQRVADIGCGAGTAVLTMARAYPRSTFIGFDVDAMSIERAEAAAVKEGLDNVEFTRCGGEEIPLEPGFDLITAFDVVHDLVDPKAVLARVHQALRPDGMFFLVEPNVSASLEENVNPGAALLYAMSTLHCMTVSLAHGGEGLGAAWGPERAESFCLEAGFRRFERLPVKNPTNAFYAVHP